MLAKIMFSSFWIKYLILEQHWTSRSHNSLFHKKKYIFLVHSKSFIVEWEKNYEHLEIL